MKKKLNKMEGSSILKRLLKIRHPLLSHHFTFRCAMRYFDEEGKVLGFENIVLDLIRAKAEADLTEIVHTIHGIVIHLVNGINIQIPVLKRRYTLHVLACVLQLRSLK